MSDAKKKKVKKDDSSSSAGFSSKPINNPHGSSGPTKKSEGFKNPFAKGKNPLAQIGDMIQSSQKAHEAKKKRSTEDRGGGKSLGGGGEGAAGNGSADARREAVIAAAEARDKKHRAKTKPTKSSSSSSASQQPPTLLSTAERRQVELERQQRAQQLKDQNAMSEEAQKAIQKAKADEAAHAASLGYNPYETNKMNAGQARTATTTMTHGSVGATDKSTTTPSSSSSSQAGTSLPAVAPPTAVVQSEEEMVPVSEAFEEAFATLVTSNTDPETVASALNILQKLVKNASTKQDDKFKRIRLANPKIKAAVSDVHGAMELLLTVGFTLFEDDATGETILVYSPDQNDVPAWLPTALHQMQQYEQTTNTK
eukprot:scaffold78981_cov43-Attheya_sp.AAC.2